MKRVYCKRKEIASTGSKFFLFETFLDVGWGWGRGRGCKQISTELPPLKAYQFTLSKEIELIRNL